MFHIKVEQVNALLSYLAKRPYSEVFQLVKILQSLEEIKEEEAEPEVE